MSSRLLQNFKGGRAIVVTRRGGWESTLETTLAKLGVSTEYPEIVDGRAEAIEHAITRLDDIGDMADLVDLLADPVAGALD